MKVYPNSLFLISFRTASPYDLFVKWGSGAKLAEPVGDAFFHKRGFAQNADKFF